ncbi:L(+)-tartrate dehydratase subunit alpha [Anaerohalosphaera lusitana]|uniref:L(+)-tartrate dehydratase subunit alpha n=1 Tax=Anaerohalosphaera lusitana TaxID=1936003 RepID=A0A1U9NHE7_9BACT|nr:fumarate hydratase [Anaerohalosphaera lusitana]AQT67235.1 L(+)-tartrate dehydratase subunit alpha [Anaerohalosphaera lusitana]
MRRIEYAKIVETVARLAIESAYELPGDVLGAIEEARAAETDERARRILDQLIENARLASEERIPLCQDTGLAVVFVEQGEDVCVEPPKSSREAGASVAGGTHRPAALITAAINEGIADGYGRGLLRKSVVAEPLRERANTKTNTPAVIHHSVVPGDELSIYVMSKGGGCENKSQVRLFNPTDSAETVKGWIVDVVREAGANACPPFVVGVGIGGNFEQACLIAKKSLLRGMGEANADEFYAQMEADLLAAVNELGIGPQGLGGRTTALAVKIETAPCHIASLPVAVNIECHSHRHKHAVL